MSELTIATTEQNRLLGGDEHELLDSLLRRLEESDNLSLDELDAIILQANAAYKSRLARLEQTRQLIGRLGTERQGE